MAMVGKKNDDFMTHCVPSYSLCEFHSGRGFKQERAKKILYCKQGFWSVFPLLPIATKMKIISLSTKFY